MGKKTEATLVISEGKIDSKGHEGTFCGDSNAFYFDRGLGYTMDAFFKTNLMIHLRFVHFFIGKIPVIYASATNLSVVLCQEKIQVKCENFLHIFIQFSVIFTKNG